MARRPARTLQHPVGKLNLLRLRCIQGLGFQGLWDYLHEYETPQPIRPDIVIDEIYNVDVLRLAANISRIDPIDRPDAHAELWSPVCGSSIAVDIKLKDGRISDFAQHIKACALGQAAASVLAQHVIGHDLAELEKLRDQMAAMLKGDGPPPGGDWQALSALAPARAATSRHGAILLPFDAVIAAIKSALVETATRDA